MVEKFKSGKVYVLKGSEKPYEEIVEAKIYKSKNDEGKIEYHLMLDSYFFTGRYLADNFARVYATHGSLESPENFNPNDYEELGNTTQLFNISDACLFEKKPSYQTLELALKTIANAKNCDFKNWKQRGDKMQKIAREALRV